MTCTDISYIIITIYGIFGSCETAYMENKLAEIRKQKKIGQSYLVEKLGVSRQSISSIENGRCTPSLELAMDIAYLLEVPIEEIFIHENRFK